MKPQTVKVTKSAVKGIHIKTVVRAGVYTSGG